VKVEIAKQDTNLLTIKAVYNILNLISAYETIKSRKGNMTPGVDETTLDGIDLKYLKNIQKLISAGKFEFSPARRILIPKPGTDKQRPLAIASPREKIVQQAIANVLTPTYEPIFLDSSHGFRPGRSTHTAISAVEAKFNSVKYIIEADFSKAFDSIQHKKLMEILKRRIKDEKLLKLIGSSLKAGYIDELGKLHSNMLEGTPQGSVLSPILCNIFLHELDTFMEGLKEKYNKGTIRPKNKLHMSLTNKIRHMRRRNQNVTQRAEFLKKLKGLLQTPSRDHDDRYIRIHYIRYADDFIVGVEGNRALAVTILNEMAKFVESLGLKFNPEKTNIINFNEEPCHFLGYSLIGPYKKGSCRGKETYKEPNSQRLALRRKKERTSVFMNTERVLNKLENNGFIRKRVKPGTSNELIFRGRYVGSLINLEHADILRRYNAVIRGIYNYYEFCNNTAAIGRIVWLLKESCGLTLARKFKLRTLRAVFSRFGENFTAKVYDNEGKEHTIGLWAPKDYKRKHITRTKVTLPLHLRN